MLIGIDEVGRGCLAGDVLACAFAIRRELDQEELAKLQRVAADSKSFSSRLRRRRAAEIIIPLGLHAIGRANITEIEERNIRGATLLAMRRAWEDLCRAHPHLLGAKILVDGRDVPPGIGSSACAVVGGDGSVLEISAASVIAKVVRDQEMEQLDQKYPGYGFAQNAGYGSPAHREALGRLGMSPAHRSWARKFTLLQN